METVKLFGYATFIYKPSEEILATPIDITGLGKDEYFMLLEKLQDILLDMDTKFATKQVKKQRTIVVKNIRIKDQRKRILYLVPFPSVVASIFKNLRAEIAEFLTYNGLKLETDPYVKRVIYLIPNSRLELLAKKIEEWNKKIERARNIIDTVFKSPYISNITFILGSFGLSKGIKIPMIRDVMVDIYPITLEVSLDIPKPLQSLVMRTRNLYLSNVLMSIYERAKEELQSKNPDAERIKALVNLANEFGLVSVAQELQEKIELTKPDISLEFLNKKLEELKQKINEQGYLVQ
jgi:hypothetical protein